MMKKRIIFYAWMYNALKLRDAGGHPLFIADCTPDWL